MHACAVVAAFTLFISVARSQRLGNIYYNRGRYDDFPSTHRARGYRVYEGEYPRFGGMSVGRRLRFDFDPTISRMPPLRPDLPYRRFEIPRFYDTNYAPAREEVRAYRPRDFAHRPRTEYERRLPRGRHAIDESPTALYHVRKQPGARYSFQPHTLALAKQKSFGRIDDHQLGLFSPLYNHVERNESPAIYSPSYPHIPDTGNNLFYPPNFKYGGEFGVNLQSDEKKTLTGNDQQENKQGKKEESTVEADGEKFFKEQEALKQQSNDRGRYYTEKLDEKKVEDQSNYRGGKSYEEQGQNQNDDEKKSSHKKGHKIHRFKTSHHKEESGDNEEYYDEQHDLGDNYQLDSNSRVLSDNGVSEFRGNAEQKKFETNQAAKVGNLESASLSETIKEDNSIGKSRQEEDNWGVYGGGGYRDEESLLGRLDMKRLAQQRSYHVPIHV